MPEMPEVETLARKLRRTVVGKRVADVRLSGLSLRRPVAKNFASKLKSRRIREVERRGKYIVVELEPKAFWLIHLGMSGRLLYHPSKNSPDKHTHAEIRFTDSTVLEYRDPRRFGLLAAYEGTGLDMIPEIRSLGVDPLHSSFNPERMLPLLQKCRQEIKSFLLDQRKVAGVGNIYACESLFLARIHPGRRCCTLNPEEAAKLVAAIRDVMKAAIRHNGTTFSDFMDSDGMAGDNQNYLDVFQREGEPCHRCGTPVRRMRQGNRSSFYCARCQV